MTTPGDFPAFPNIGDDPRWNGMTYRQWLIGQALAGLLSSREKNGRDDIVKWATQIVDATIKAMEEKR